MPLLGGAGEGEGAVLGAFILGMGGAGGVEGVQGRGAVSGGAAAGSGPQWARGGDIDWPSS